MNLFKRLVRLCKLSSVEVATLADIKVIEAHLTKIEVQKLEKIIEWIGVLLKSEMLRREQESAQLPRRTLR
jgi:hypothetical protein